MVKIAVEEPFTSVQQALTKKGYKAAMLENKTDATSYDCVVVRDKEDFADFHMNVPLVEAKGRTLFEIIEEVEERLVRSGKIMPPSPIVSDNKSGGGGGFIAGAATGALIGAAAGLMLAPKSGKELQQTVKDKAAEMKEKKEAKSDENSGGGKLDQVKEKISQVKEKTSGVTEKAKEKADELKAKREEKKEDKELKKQQKAVEKSIKEEEKAEKEHEKAVKQAEKEEKKAEKEEKKESGGIEVVEFGSSTVKKDDSGKVNIQSNDKNKNK